MGFKDPSIVKHFHCLMTSNWILALFDENDNGFTYCMSVLFKQGKLVKWVCCKEITTLLTDQLRPYACTLFFRGKL